MSSRLTLAAWTLAALMPLAALAQTAPAPAPLPANASKKDLVARVLLLQQPGVELVAQQLAEQPALQLAQQARQALPRVAADKREAVARDIDGDLRKYAEEVVPMVRERATRLAPGTIGPILEERFTEGELRQVIAILESPVNRKFQNIAPEMQRALTEKLVTETRPLVEPKVRAMNESVGRRLGLPVNPPAAPASGPGARK